MLINGFMLVSPLSFIDRVIISKYFLIILELLLYLSRSAIRVSRILWLIVNNLVNNCCSTILRS